MDWFRQYRNEFEQAVTSGVMSGVLGCEKPVPVMAGKLSRKRIGRVLGTEIDSGEIVVIDYYGYMKKSKGFSSMAAEAIKGAAGKQVKTISAPVVHFNSVRLEVMAKIAPGLVPDFGDFKKAVLDAREFNHNYRI